MKTSISFVVGLLGVAACLGADPNESVIRFGSRVKALQAQSLDTMQAEEPPVALAAKTLTRAQFTSVAEWCWVAKTQLDDGNEYTLLDLPGRAAGGAIGSPRLPYYGKFIRVPNGAEVRLVVDEVTRSEIAGRYMVAPEHSRPRCWATIRPAPLSPGTLPRTRRTHGHRTCPSALPIACVSADETLSMLSTPPSPSTRRRRPSAPPAGSRGIWNTLYRRAARRRHVQTRLGRLLSPRFSNVRSMGRCRRTIPRLPRPLCRRQ